MLTYLRGTTLARSEGNRVVDQFILMPEILLEKPITNIQSWHMYILTYWLFDLIMITGGASSRKITQFLQHDTCTHVYLIEHSRVVMNQVVGGFTDTSFYFSLLIVGS